MTFVNIGAETKYLPEEVCEEDPYMPFFPRRNVIDKNILKVWESQLELFVQKNTFESHYGDSEGMYTAIDTFVNSRAVLNSYSFVYGITVDPFATPIDLNVIPTYGYNWGDFLIRLLKCDLDEIHNESELVEALKVRGLPPVLLKAEDIIDYIDFERIPRNLRGLFSSPDQLKVFDSHAFIRMPIREEAVKKGLLPEFVLEGPSNMRTLQWIDFSDHPEVGLFQSKLRSVLLRKYNNIIPCIALSSANISKKTPETTDSEGVRDYWTSGSGLRNLLMPTLLHMSESLNKKIVHPSLSFYKKGSYPIYSIEFNRPGEGSTLDGYLYVARVGNIPYEYQKSVLQHADLRIDESTKPHNYEHPKLSEEVLELLSACKDATTKSRLLHYLSLGETPERISNII